MYVSMHKDMFFHTCIFKDSFRVSMCISARYRQQIEQAQTYYRHAAVLVPFNGMLHYR